MRKIALVLAVIMVLMSLPVSAMAAEPRAISIVPGITFNGTTAICEVSIVGNNMSDDLAATIRLYRGNTVIATWFANGDGYIDFSRTKIVTAGYTYTLTVSLTYNGEACTPVSQTARL